MLFEVTLNFSKRKGVYTSPNLTSSVDEKNCLRTSDDDISLPRFCVPLKIVGENVPAKHGLRSLGGIISCLLNQRQVGPVSSALC